MVNYWLRTNKKENYGTNEKLWGDTQKTREYEIGDQIILYITDGKDGKYLVAVLEYLGNLKTKQITKNLPEEKWVERPSVEEWGELIRRSLERYAPHLLEMKRNQRIGIVAQQGQQLVKEDFEVLKELIVKQEASK